MAERKIMPSQAQMTTVWEQEQQGAGDAEATGGVEREVIQCSIFSSLGFAGRRVKRRWIGGWRCGRRPEASAGRLPRWRVRYWR